jgi:hypothetical protein
VWFAQAASPPGAPPSGPPLWRGLLFVRLVRLSRRGGPLFTAGCTDNPADTSAQEPAALIRREAAQVKCVQWLCNDRSQGQANPVVALFQHARSNNF